MTSTINAPMTRLALGQCKYLKAYHERLDCLLRNNQYSHLEEVRHNRFVRTYHGRTGKMALAHDEWHDKAPKGITNVIDKIMEYEPKILVPDIDDHVFTNEDGIDDDGADDEEQEMTMEISGVMTRPCLMDLVKVGWNNLKEMNVNKIRMVVDEQMLRKRMTTEYIVD